LCATCGAEARWSVWDRLGEQIQLEREELGRLVDRYRPLLGISAERVLDEYETAAVGAMLHSFYNGVENILRRVAIEIDGGLPQGEAWHKQLLESMTKPRAGRPAVISEELCERLKPYLHFRHFFRSAYVLTLRWEKIAPLAAGVEDVLAALDRELALFLGHLPPERLSHGLE